MKPQRISGQRIGTPVSSRLTRFAIIDERVRERVLRQRRLEAVELEREDREDRLDRVDRDRQAGLGRGPPDRLVLLMAVERLEAAGRQVDAADAGWPGVPADVVGALLGPLRAGDERRRAASAPTTASARTARRCRPSPARSRSAGRAPSAASAGCRGRAPRRPRAARRARGACRRRSSRPASGSGRRATARGTPRAAPSRAARGRDRSPSRSRAGRRPRALGVLGELARRLVQVDVAVEDERRRERLAPAFLGSHRHASSLPS